MVFGSKNCVVPGCSAKAAKKSHKCNAHQDGILCAWPLCPFSSGTNCEYCPFHKCSDPPCLQPRWHDRSSWYCHEHHQRRTCHATTSHCSEWVVDGTSLCQAHTCTNAGCHEERHLEEEYCRACENARNAPVPERSVSSINLLPEENPIV